MVAPRAGWWFLRRAPGNDLAPPENLQLASGCGTSWPCVPSAVISIVAVIALLRSDVGVGRREGTRRIGGDRGLPGRQAARHRSRARRTQPDGPAARSPARSREGGAQRRRSRLSTAAGQQEICEGRGLAVRLRPRPRGARSPGREAFPRSVRARRRPGIGAIIATRTWYRGQGGSDAPRGD